MREFDYSKNYKLLNLRECPELYRVGKGEQGVLLVEPYKSEILPLWKFRNSHIANESAQAILKMFYQYAAQDDFIGMDMSRKFLQMGFTRSRRYANHKSGKKYDGPVPDALKGRSGAYGRSLLPIQGDVEKARSAEIFKAAWDEVEQHSRYKMMKANWKLCFG
jgi:hypothetical protein